MFQKIQPGPIFLFFTLFLLEACTPAVATQPSILTARDDIGTAVATPTLAQATPLPLETITLPISVYIVDDKSGESISDRDADEMMAIYERTNDIWAQANIEIKVETIQRLTLPDEIVQNIARGDFRPFFTSIDYEFTIPEPSLLNGFYVSNIGGANGIVPFGADLFFITDKPSVHDERVTAHEIGHILGLHHTLTDSDRLMFSGTNGMTLTEEEVIVARYVAQGLLDRVR